MTAQAPKGPETAVAIVGGRSITVRRPTAGQATLIQRHGKIVQTAMNRAIELMPPEGDDETELAEDAKDMLGRGLAAAGDMLDVVERLVVDYADREWLQEQIKEGVLDLPDLEGLLVPFQKRDGGKGGKAKRVK